MARSYKAILNGNQVEWIGGPPQTEEKTAGELLQTLADTDAFADITDPVAWQREQRKDRPLPYRDARLASFDCWTRSRRVCDEPRFGTG